MTDSPRSSPETILVVDDNLQNRLVAEGHLVSAGYEVQLTEDGERAIEIFRAGAPDLILLDVMMPGLNGFETCQRLRQMPGGAGTPILFLTALSDLSSHQQAMESGADDYLTKPINRTELLLRVRSLLRIKRLSCDLQRNLDLVREQRDALLHLQAQKEELVALLVHDLKHPLAGILGHVRLLSHRPELFEDPREALRDVASAAETMHTMVLNLLDISRAEEGQLILRASEFDLRELVEEVRAETVRRAEETHRLVAHGPSSPTPVCADRDLLRRLLENLIDNSLKYTPAGGTITLEADADAEATIELRISDEGPGIPPALRTKIFEKYVQLDRDVKTHGRTSRGLGLVFCKLAVEAHGGTIWVQDHQPRGSTFCVRLPRQTSPSVENEPR